MTVTHQPIKNIAQIISGATPRTANKNYYGGDILWATPKDLSDMPGMYLKDTAKKLTQVGYESCSARMLPAGSILFSSRAPIGLIAIAQKPICTNQGFKSLVPKDDVCSEYLYYCLRHYIPHIKSLGRGATFKEISSEIIGNVQLPFPDFKSQQKIAEILKKTESALKKRSASTGLLDDFLKSTFLEMFGDPIKNPNKYPIKNLRALSVEDPSYGAGASACPYNPKEPRYVRITDVDELGNLDDECVSAELSADENIKYALREGDVLFARSGATVGKTYRYRSSHGPCVYAGYMIRFRLDLATAHPDYVFFFTKTKAYKMWIEARKKVVAQPNINAKQYGWELKIPMPAISEQMEFSKIVNRVQKLKEKMKSSETELQNLFNALMQKAFKGELA